MEYDAINFDFIYGELQNQYTQLRKLEENKTLQERKEKYQRMATLAKELLELGQIARYEGLLALEESIRNLPKEREFVKRVASYVIDGDAPELVVQLATFKYISSEKDPYLAIENIMTIIAMLSIQKGYNPRLLKDFIYNVVPEEVVRLMEESGKKQEKEKEILEEEVDFEKYCVGELHLNLGDEGFEEVLKCDKIFRRLSNHEMQSALFLIDDENLCGIMLGLSGEARKCILKNMRKKKVREIVNWLEQNVAQEPADYKIENQFSKVYMKEVAQKIIQQLQYVMELPWGMWV